MALTDAAHFFKTRKEKSKKIIAKYTRQNDEAYLEAAYDINARLVERVPLVSREGIDIQLREALLARDRSVERSAPQLVEEA